MRGTNQIELSKLIKKEDDNLNALLVYGTEKKTGNNRLLMWYQKGNELEKFYELRGILTKAQANKIVTWMEEFHPERFEDSEVEI